MNRRVVIALASVCLLAVAALAVGLGLFDGEYERVVLDIEDAETGETLATVDARVADTTRKRYVGLSNTDSLGRNEGMVFVHDGEDERAYVMRDMAFAIDIVFIDAGGRITEIHSGEPESPPYTEYSGRGAFVLEVRRGFTNEHDIGVGDRVNLTDV